MTPSEIAKGLSKALVGLWCDLTHGGGKIERDDQGRINWRCSKCGRWADIPVSSPQEQAAVRAIIEQESRGE